jgi:hypothetical protein
MLGSGLSFKKADRSPALFICQTCPLPGARSAFLFSFDSFVNFLASPRVMHLQTAGKDCPVDSGTGIRPFHYPAVGNPFD